MKTILKSVMVLVLPVTAILLTQCSALEKADDVSFGATLDTAINANEATVAENVTYAQAIVLDATANANIKKYESKLKNISINKITYKITNVNEASDITMTDAVIAYSAKSSSTPVILSSLGTLNFGTAEDNEVQLTISQQNTSSISKLLLDDKAVKFYISGTLSQTPILFDLIITVDVKVTANAF